MKTINIAPTKQFRVSFWCDSVLIGCSPIRKFKLLTRFTNASAVRFCCLTGGRDCVYNSRMPGSRAWTFVVMPSKKLNTFLRLRPSVMSVINQIPRALNRTQCRKTRVSKRMLITNKLVP